MISHNNFWPVFLVVSTVIVGILIGFGDGGTVQLVAIILYLLFCPGLALIRLVRLSDPLAEFVLAIASSIALDLLLAETMVLLHLWSPAAGFFALAIFCFSSAFLQYAIPARVSR